MLTILQLAVGSQGRVLYLLVVLILSRAIQEVLGYMLERVRDVVDVILSATSSLNIGLMLFRKR
jgi:hypothetical protein